MTSALSGRGVTSSLVAALLLALAACSGDGGGPPISTTVSSVQRGERYLITTSSAAPDRFEVRKEGAGRGDPALMAELVQRRRNCAYLERLSLSEDGRTAVFRGAFCRGSDFWR